MLDEGEYVCAMFMDLSKAFDTDTHHDLMTGFSVYGFSRDTFQYMRSYLTKRNQKV